MAMNIFEPVYNTHGMYGLQCKECSTGIQKGTKAEHHIVMVVWRSPHASADQNVWLERKLLRLYTRYYLKVIVETMGRFW